MLKKVFMSRKKRLTVTSLKNNPAIYTYHRDEHHDLDDEDGWFAMGILSTIIGVWWGIFHLVDAFTFDKVPWWAEPFTIIPVFAYVIFSEITHSFNPLHWWPLVWGYKVEVQNDRVLHSIELDDIVKKYGGPMNVYVDGPFNLKFRKKKDVLKYCLFR